MFGGMLNRVRGKEMWLTLGCYDWALSGLEVDGSVGYDIQLKGVRKIWLGAFPSDDLVHE